MSILNFMPQFVPWYTKSLLKKDEPEIEDAKQPSTGFFGDVFDYIDDAFTWTPNPEPETNWGGGQLGAGFGEQAPAYEPYIEPDYSGMGDPFGMNDPFTEEDWTSAPSTPSPWAGPILGGMFGSAPPAPGIGSAIGGSLGSGEGWGFDLIDEPAQSWDMYAPPPTPAPWTGGVTGGMFAPPEPMSFPDIGNQWGSAWNDWSAPPEPAPFASDLGFNFRDSLANSLSRDEAWADVQDMRATPAPELGTSSWDALPLSGVPGNGIGSAIGDIFSGFGASLGDQISEPLDLAPRPPYYWGEEWTGRDRPLAPGEPEYQLRSDWSMFGNGDTGLGMMPDGWDQMSPQERGEYVYFSGLKGEDYLSDSDWARMSPDLRQRIGYADSRIEGGISNGFASLWDTIETPFNAAYETVGDLVVDPILQPLDSTGNRISPFQKDFWSKGPSLNIGTSTPSQVDFAIPLEDTVQNIQDATNPWDFLETQGDAFKERPLAQQIGIPFLTPGSGIYKNIEGAPQWLRTSDSIIDLLQGGAALDNIGDIPGASSALRNVIAPGLIGGGLGAVTEAIFDPTYQYIDPITGEVKSYDPGYLESIGGGALLGIGGNAAMRSGTVPFGASIDNVGRSMDEFVDDFLPVRKADLPLDEVVPTVPTASIADGFIEDPAEALIRQQQDIFATDPLASAPFTTPSAVTPSASQAADAAATPPRSATVEQTVSHINDILKDRGNNEELRRSAFNKWQAQVFAEAPTNAEAKRILSNVRMETFGPKTAPLTFEQGKALKATLKAKAEELGYGPFVSVRAEKAVDALVAGENGYPSDLRHLRNLLTDTPYSAATADAIESVVPSPAAIPTEPGMTKPIDETLSELASTPLTQAEKEIVGADDALFPAAEYSPVSTSTAPTDSGAFQTSLGSVDSTGQYRSPGTPGIPDEGPLAPRRPLWGEADKGVRQGEYPFSSGTPTTAGRVPNESLAKVDAWEQEMVERGANMQPEALNRFLDAELEKFIVENGSDVSSMARISRSKIPSKIQKRSLAGWQAPFTEAMPSGAPTDIPTETGSLVSRRAAEMADAGPTSGEIGVPAVAKPIVDEWEQSALAAVKDLPMNKRADVLDRMQLELSKKLREKIADGAAVSQSERARNRVVYAIDQQNKKVVSDALAEWRRINVPELDDIKMFANTSWGERYVGGALKNKLADVMTTRGRDLTQFLENRGYTFQEAKDITEDELGRYLEDRVMREAKAGNKNALLDHALTQVHMGDFRPKIDGANVPKGTGEVPGWINAARTGNAGLKGLFFGMADAGAIMANAIPAIQAQGIPLGVGYLNRILKLVDIDDASKYRAFSGSAMGASQDVFDDKVGTLIGVAGRGLQSTPISKAGDALVALDKPAVKWNQFLEKAQFDWLLNKGLRQPAFDGNLVILKMLGRDINDPSLQRTVARMTNAATSTAPLARNNTQRGVEGATLGSARFLRAQGDLLLAATKLINPKASLDERIVAMTAIVSVAASIAAARELAGERLDLNPFRDGQFNPNFGNITLPDGTIVPFFQQKQLARTLAQSLTGLASAVQDKGDASAITDPLIKFMINRQGPLPATFTRYAGIGYDPQTNKYSWPGKGPGFGSEMDGWDKLANAVPIPVGLSGFIRSSDATDLSRGLNVIGGGTYPQSPLTAALEKEGVSTWKEFEALDPDTYSSRKEDFKKKYADELGDSFTDSTIKDYQEAKKANSEEFMQSKYDFTVKNWTERRKELADQTSGAYNELGIEEKERPEKDGSAQWIYDYNQTFSQALDEPGNPASGLNTERLGELQAEYWAKHPDPKVRKEVLDYQLARAETEADKLFIKSMARLQGIDPSTGAPLTTKSGKRTMPNYFTMDRYEWNELNNEDARDVLARFVQWRDSLPEVVVEDMKREDLIKMFIEKVPDQAYRPDSKPWTPAAIRDVITYGRDTAETPEFTAYKEQMRPELLWFSPDKTWKTIKEANEKAGRN